MPARTGAGEAREFGAADARTRDRSMLVFMEQVKLLYTQATVSQTVAMLNALVLAVVLWPVVDHAIVAVWLATIVIASAARLALAWRFEHASLDVNSIPYWHNSFLIGVALSGCVWGASAVLIFPEHSVPHQLFLVFVLGGMTAGAVSALSSLQTAFLLFLVPTLIPIAIRMLIVGDEIHLAMGWMIAVYVVAMILISRRLGHVLEESLYLRYENAALVASHNRVRDRADILEAELSLEIASRKQRGKQ
ncbi:MAG: hypothetical protein HYU77_17975 [Betaproteobacteria bacterium]|nr:hypothetical protein [Betaproteobacteria bacterium]